MLYDVTDSVCAVVVFMVFASILVRTVPFLAGAFSLVNRGTVAMISIGETEYGLMN